MTAHVLPGMSEGSLKNMTSVRPSALEPLTLMGIGPTGSLIRIPRDTS